MSKVFNMVGGGGGPAASIFVTGLSQTDTVTATNGSKTKAGVWTTKDSVSGWLFDKIKDFGTWTVTATDGTDTYTQDVLVDVITEYEIEITKKLYLYRDGDECEDVTGGWTVTALSEIASGWSDGSANLSISKQDQYMTLQQSAANRYCVASLSAANKIPIGKYTKLCIEVDVTQGGAYWQLRIAASDSRKQDAQAYESIVEFNTVGKDLTDNGYMELDISAIQNDCYVYFASGCDSSMTGVRKLNIHQIWLE